jgi:YHS domain-containing protein
MLGKLKLAAAPVGPAAGGRRETMSRTRWILLLGAAFLAGSAGAAQQSPPDDTGLTVRMICPLKKAHRDSEIIARPVRVNGIQVYACDDANLALLKKNPPKYLEGTLADPVNRKRFTIGPKTPWAEHDGNLFLFSSTETKAAFLKEPAKYVKPQHSQ